MLIVEIIADNIYVFDRLLLGHARWLGKLIVVLDHVEVFDPRLMLLLHDLLNLLWLLGQARCLRLNRTFFLIGHDVLPSFGSGFLEVLNDLVSDLPLAYRFAFLET